MKGYSLLKKGLVTLASVFYFSSATLTWADDTDIYLHNPNLDSSVKPNVLFVLDNSGSMEWTVDKEQPPKDGEKSRMEIMQDAFRDIMESSSGLNVGLMKLWAREGESSQLTYPVTDIDKPMGSSIIVDGSPEIAERADDGHETSNGQVVLSSDFLPLGGFNTSSSRAKAFSTSVSSSISQTKDNAEGINFFGGFNFKGDELEFSSSSGHSVNALYFRDLNIPENAVIDSAFVTFTASRKSESSDAYFKILAELDKRPDNLDVNSYYFRKKSNVEIDWRSDERWYQGNTYQTADISALIQSILDSREVNFQPGEELDNLALFFEFQKGGKRYAEKYSRGESYRAAKLEFSYTVPNNKDNYLTGLRFQTLGIPQGATVSSATIDFTASDNNDEEISLQVWAGQPGSTHNDAFTEMGFDLSKRAKIGPIIWTPDPWVKGTPENPNRYSVDVTSLVQQVVSDSSWCGNNPSTFYLKLNSGEGLRRAFSFDGSSALRPKLNIEYSGGENGCRNELINTRIQASSHDAYEDFNNSNKVYDLRDYLIAKGSNRSLVGLQYQRFPIKKDALILDAWLELTAYDHDNSSATLRIQAEDTDNSKPIKPSKRDLSNRTKTTSKVDWTDDKWVKNVTYRSPDISSIIQEVVNRQSWQAGNNLTLLVSAKSGLREIISFNKNPSLSPRLIIKVASGGIDSDSGYKVKDHLISLVDKMYPSGGTPLTPTFYEAAKYFRDGKSSHPSPINNVCQSNYTVLLTDGEANSSESDDWNRINSLTGGYQHPDGYTTHCKNDSGREGEKCARTLSTWLNTTDLSKDGDMPGTQNVFTHTIAFGLKNNQTVQKFLKDLAHNGGGEFYTADNAAELAKAFNNIITGIIEDESSFVSPGVTANQFNN